MKFYDKEAVDRAIKFLCNSFGATKKRTTIYNTRTNTMATTQDGKDIINALPANVPVYTTLRSIQKEVETNAGDGTTASAIGYLIAFNLSKLRKFTDLELEAISKVDEEGVFETLNKSFVAGRDPRSLVKTLIETCSKSNRALSDDVVELMCDYLDDSGINFISLDKCYIHTGNELEVSREKTTQFNTVFPSDIQLETYEYPLFATYNGSITDDVINYAIGCLNKNIKEEKVKQNTKIIILCQHVPRSVYNRLAQDGIKNIIPVYIPNLQPKTLDTIFKVFRVGLGAHDMTNALQLFAVYGTLVDNQFNEESISHAIDTIKTSKLDPAIKETILEGLNVLSQQTNHEEMEKMASGILGVQNMPILTQVESASFDAGSGSMVLLFFKHQEDRIAKYLDSILSSKDLTEKEADVYNYLKDIFASDRLCFRINENTRDNGKHLYSCMHDVISMLKCLKKHKKHYSELLLPGRRYCYEKLQINTGIEVVNEFFKAVIDDLANMLPNPSDGYHPVDSLLAHAQCIKNIKRGLLDAQVYADEVICV